MSSPQHPQNQSFPTPPQLDPLADTCYVPMKDGGTMIDMDAYVIQMRADLALRNFYMISNKKTEAEFYEWFDTEFEPDLRQRISPVVSGARPTPENPTVRYTHIPAIHDDYPSLTIRWWLDLGNQSEYNFDFINATTGQPIAPGNLKILLRVGGDWQMTMSIGEAIEKDPSQRFWGPPRWIAEPGGRLRLVRSTDDSILGEVFVPQIPYDEYPQYTSFKTLADALKNDA